MGKTPTATETAVGVARLIHEQWPALRSDFRRFYGLDLHEACFGGAGGHGIGARDLRDLISTLPQESALARAMGWHWTNQDEMLALLVEVTHQQTWAVFRTMAASYAAAGGKAPRPPKAPKLTRPTRLGEEKPRPRTVADVISMFRDAGALA